MIPRAAFLALALAAAPAAEAQTLFKCVGKDGKVTYQAEKCAEAARQSTVRPPDPPSRRPPPAEEAPAAKPGDAPAAAGDAEPPVDWEAFVAQISSFENCLATVPGFGARHNAAYQRWKERYRAAYAKFNQDGAAQRRVRESTEYVRGRMGSRTPEERQYDIDTCENKVAPNFSTINPATSNPTKN